MCYNGDMTSDNPVRDLWARILAVDETSHEYHAERHDWPGAIVFTNPQNESFNLALIQDVAPAQVDPLLDAIVDHYRGLGVPPRIRLTPFSRPDGWQQRLTERGFAHVDEDEVFLLLSGRLTLAPNPMVQVKHVPEQATPEVFARTQQAGFDAPPEDWARGIELAERAVVAGRYRFYVAYLDGEPAGAASARLDDGLAGLYGITTLPAFRKRGVSTALIHHIAAAAAAEGHHLVFLSASPGSYAARLYARLGFLPLFDVQNFALKA